MKACYREQSATASDAVSRTQYLQHSLHGLLACLVQLCCGAAPRDALVVETCLEVMPVVVSPLADRARSMAAGSLLTVPILRCAVLCPYSCCAKARCDDQRYAMLRQLNSVLHSALCIMHLLALYCKGAADAACHSSAGPHIDAL